MVAGIFDDNRVEDKDKSVMKVGLNYEHYYSVLSIHELKMDSKTNML